MEQPLGTFRLGDPLALIAVLEQILDRVTDRIGDVRTLALDDDERDAVDEEDDVRQRVPMRSRTIDAKLVDGEEIVALRTLKVDEPDDLLSPTVAPLDAFDDRSLTDKLRCLLVGLHETRRRHTLDRIHGKRDSRVIQPLRSVPVHIDAADRLTKPIAQQHLGKARAAGYGRIMLAPFDARPAHRLELDQQRRLDVDVFGVRSHLLEPRTLMMATGLDWAGVFDGPYAHKIEGRSYPWRSLSYDQINIRWAGCLAHSVSKSLINDISPKPIAAIARSGNSDNQAESSSLRWIKVGVKGLPPSSATLTC